MHRDGRQAGLRLRVHPSLRVDRGQSVQPMLTPDKCPRAADGVMAFTVPRTRCSTK